jgi:hypothetical protein
MAIAMPEQSEPDFADHVRTYRAFVKYATLFAAHVLLVLALLAYFLA